MASTAQAAKAGYLYFDLVWQIRESYQMGKNGLWRQKAGAEINLIPRQDEAVADNDFKAGA